MSHVIGIMGASGHGKTTSMRNLPPDQTLYVDGDRKGLTWPKWKRDWKEGENYFKTGSLVGMDQLIDQVDRSAKYKHIKYLVIDTLNAGMVNKEMDQALETGYAKWIDLAKSVFSIVAEAGSKRDDLFIILVFHSMDSGKEGEFHQIAVVGKKLEKIQMETRLPILLFSKQIVGQNGERTYVFETQAYNSTAKSPMGLFDNFHIPNDMMKVIEQYKEYMGEDGDGGEGGSEKPVKKETDKPVKEPDKKVVKTETKKKEPVKETPKETPKETAKAPAKKEEPSKEEPAKKESSKETSKETPKDEPDKTAKSDVPAREKDKPEEEDAGEFGGMKPTIVEHYKALLNMDGGKAIWEEALNSFGLEKANTIRSKSIAEDFVAYLREKSEIDIPL